MTEKLSRQQRRRIDREHVKSGQLIAARGLPAEPRRAAMRDVAALMRSKLAERDNDHRAGEAAAIAHALAEKSLARQPGQVAIACRSGCSACCHTFVGASPPEVFRLAAAVRQGRAGGVTPDSVRERALQTRDLPPDARMGAKIACPLLQNDTCSLYAERPLVCRQATSVALSFCLEEFEGQGSSADKVEVSSAHLAHAGNAHVAMLGAMIAMRLPIHGYELASALDIALRTPDSERRWLQGEDIFAALPRHVRRPAALEMVAHKISDDLDS